MNLTLFILQDSLVRSSPDSLPAQAVLNDSTSSLKKFSPNEAEAIFLSIEKREKKIDSIARVRAEKAHILSLKQQKATEWDTTAVPYASMDNGAISVQNPLKGLNKQFFSAKDTAKPIFHEEENSPGFISNTEIAPRFPEPLPASQDLRPDWLLFIVIGSLVLLAWLKLFYNKFLDQTVQSIGNFQLSTKLLRDQNIFSRRVAFALNVNFVVIGATYVYLISEFFHIQLFPLKGILSFLAFAGILSGLLILRYIVSRTIGHIFQMQSPFREYLHQLLLIYKTLGIALLVMVIGIAYIRQDLRIYLVLLSGLLLLSALILRIAKGLKVVLVSKDVLIFYLILYLCTLEFLPILILYRLFSSSLTGGQV